MTRKAVVVAALVFAACSIIAVSAHAAPIFNQDWGGAEDDWAVSTYDGNGAWAVGMNTCKAAKHCVTCAVDVNDRPVCIKTWFSTPHCKCEIKESVSSESGYVRRCYHEGTCTYTGS